jgi:hypothetical protein
MTRDFWSDSSFANAKETGRANRLTPERVMRGVKGFYAYSIDRPAYGVDDLDRYACAIMAGGNGDGISCWGANQGEIGADGARGLGMSPAAIAGLPTIAEILSLELRADRACATVSRRGVEGVEHWCWEHRVASAEPVDESAPYVVERMEVGQAYQSDLHKKYGLTLRDGFLSGDGEPYCQIATPFRDGTGGGPVSMNCRGYDDLPFYISGYWLDTGESLGIASSSPETRWFGNVLNNGEGGTIEGRPAGVKLWLGQIEATASYICAAYQLSPNVAPNGDPNHQGVYCYTRQPAPGGWPQVAWAQRAIEIPRITRASNSESLNASTAPSIGELAVVANRLPSGREDGNGCALLNADLLLCWGHNDLGQLGSGDTEDRPNGYFVRFNLETE